MEGLLGGRGGLGGGLESLLGGRGGRSGGGRSSRRGGRSSGKDRGNHDALVDLLGEGDGLGALLGGGGFDEFLENVRDNPEALDAIMSQVSGSSDLLGDLSGSLSGGAQARAPRKPAGPSFDRSCTCGYTCGTESALNKHLEKFRGDPKHEARISERPPTPPLRPSPSKPRGRDAGGQGQDQDNFVCVNKVCSCGYTCGTAKAFDKHLQKFEGKPGHALM